MPDDPRKDLDEALEAPLEERLRAALEKLREEGDDADLDEIERKLFELGETSQPREEAVAKLNEIEDEFDARMRSLESKATAVREQREAQVRQEERKLKSDANAAKGLGVGLSVAYAIIGMPVLGYLIGWGIDGKPGGPNGNWTVILGAILGFVGAAVLLKRADQIK